MNPNQFRSFFRGEPPGAQLRWHCEPTRWEVDPSSGALIVRPDAGTDFWQRTHYGFEADNGHFLHLPVTGDFTLTTQVRSQPIHQYDQAGLMVRISEGCWLKTSIEFEPEGPNRLGAVVTNGQYSDWSTQSISQEVDVLWLRVRGEGSDFFVESSLDGTEWQQIRMARLLDRSSVSSVSAGVYACSPKQAGMQASFSFLDLQPSHPASTAVSHSLTSNSSW